MFVGGGGVTHGLGIEVANRARAQARAVDFADWEMSLSSESSDKAHFEAVVDIYGTNDSTSTTKNKL